MKVIVKILILMLAVTLAIGGVMIYAKTRVEPPQAPQKIDQYQDDLSKCYDSFDEISGREQEDLKFLKIWNRLCVFEQQGKISKSEMDDGLDAVLEKYMPLFVNRSYALFRKSVWNEEDHQYMLDVISFLKQMKYSNGKDALNKKEKTECEKIENIIESYEQALEVSKHRKFVSVKNAQEVISKANQFAKDTWLSNCTDLVNALNRVKPSIAESHYNYASSRVEELSQYKYYSFDYYDNTLVPQVEAVVNEYDQKAYGLYGSKRDVDVLWNRAKSYYNDAYSYYNNNNQNTYNN